MKKVFGILLLALFALSLFGAYIDGDFSQHFASPATAIGYYIGFSVSMVPFLFGGIFLITFDRVNKMAYHKAVAIRKSQIGVIIFLLILSVVLLYLTVWSIFYVYYFPSVGEMILAILLACWPMLIACIIFVFMLTIYCFSFTSCKKNCGNTEDIINEYLANPDAFTDISQNGSILANDRALIFPKLYCVIPFDKIRNLKSVNILVARSVIFVFTNGKMLEINTFKYPAIAAAWEAYRQNTSESNS